VFAYRCALFAVLLGATAIGHGAAYWQPPAVTVQYHTVGGLDYLAHTMPQPNPLAALADPVVERFGAWPAEEWINAYAVEGCESKHGQDPKTYLPGRANGGVMQLNRATWEDLFAREYGWSWSDIVNNDVLNHKAARIIWDRAGGLWTPWDCYNGD
jgi:hypothetical protein